MSSPKREAIIHTEFQIVLTSPVAAYTLADVKRAGAELARMHLRLGTNAAYFRSQISRLYSIKEFIDGSNRRPQLRQALLQDSMRLLQQLLQIAAACVQQLSRQVSSLDAGNAILAPASMFCASILENLSLVTQPIDAMTSGPSMMVNRQVLGLLQDTGVLAAYTAAARAATQSLTHLLQRGHRVQPPDAAQLQPRQKGAGSKLVANTAGVGALLLQLWTCCTRLLPEPDLMQPGSMFAATLQPSAALAMNVMRGYAASGYHAAGPAYVVMKTAVFVATTASHAEGQQEYFAALGPPTGLQDVLELLLVALGLCCEVLHADYQGRSQQVLLKSLASTVQDGTCSTTTTRSNSTSSPSNSSTSTCTRDVPSGSRRIAVPPHHQELLYTLLGVRQLAHCFGESDSVAATETVREGFLVIPVGINGALAAWKMLHRAAGCGQASQSSSSTSTSSSQPDAPNAPWVYALPLQLTLIELLALAPPFLVRNMKLLCVLVHLLPTLQRQLLDLVYQLNPLQAPPPAPTTPGSSGRGRRRGGSASSSDSSSTSSYSRSSSSSSSSRELPVLPVPLDPAHSKALAQRCIESLWLYLGPVLLSVCRLHDDGDDDDAEGEASDEYTRVNISTIPGLSPRVVFGAYAAALLMAVRWQALTNGCLINIAAVIESNPLMSCMVAEAALHTVPSWSMEPRGPAGQGPTQQAMVQCASLLHCTPAYIVANFMAEAGFQLLPTGGGTAAARKEQVQGGAAPRQQQQQLLGPLFAAMTAALKHSLITPPGSAGDVGLFHSKCNLVSDLLLAGLRVLGHAEASAMGAYIIPLVSESWSREGATAAESCFDADAKILGLEQHVAMLALLARAVAAAACVLQLVPLHVTAAGGFVMQEAPCTQYGNLHNLLMALVMAVEGMQSILEPGHFECMADTAETHSTVTAGVTSAGVAKLGQQAGALHDSLALLVKLYHRDEGDLTGNMDSLSQEQVAANRALRAACLPGSVLLDQLAEFAGGCYAAFPQPRCCGNPACSSLDGFSEAALAAKVCSRCKAVKFCSPECMGAAWKTGHRAACAVLKQRQSPAAPAALPLAGAAAPTSSSQALGDTVVGNRFTRRAS